MPNLIKIFQAHLEDEAEAEAVAALPTANQGWAGIGY